MLLKAQTKEQQKQSLDPEEGRLDTMPAGNWEPLEVSNWAEQSFLALKKGNPRTSVNNKLERRMTGEQPTYEGETLVNHRENYGSKTPSRSDNKARNNC